MSFRADQLFALLPTVYRNRDAALGDPLQALYAVLAQQFGVVEDNVEQLYDDQFIETCAPWVIPYIGDLVGYNSVYQIASASFDSRAEVANTVGYRRRKGTLLALEQLCADISGRAAVAVEEFRHLITTESMRLVRPLHATTVDLRHGTALDRSGTVFDTGSRRVDVRRIAPRLRVASNPDPAPLDIALHGPGNYNIPDIAIHLWRWKSWPVTEAPAFPIGEGRYMFSALGHNIPLFSQPPARASFSGLTTRMDVPQPISRREFAQDLRSSDASAFYGPAASILLLVDGIPISSSQITCANLSDRDGGSWCTVPPGRIAIDPELGRIQFAADLALPQSLRVNYSYGFPAEIAGGPYDRSSSLTMINSAGADFVALIGTSAFPTLEGAVTQWNELTVLAPNSTGVIVLPDFERFSINLTGAAAIQLPAGCNLSIAAGHPIATNGSFDVIWNHSCVTLEGDMDVVGVAGAPLPEGEVQSAGQLIISGLWIAGRLSVLGETATVVIADSTFVPGIGISRAGVPLSPGDPSIQVSAAKGNLTLIRSISGPIAAIASGTTRVCSSIVDATSPCCVAYAAADLASAGADLHVEDSTIIGKVHTRTLPLASNTIFFARRPRRDPWPAAIWAMRRQTGCVRFCSLPSDSITPRRYLCLPAEQAGEAALAPKFITLRYGNPAYALLSGDVPMALWRGADNGSQIGVYYQIQETEAVRNVQLRAPEFLPACLESGIFLHPSRPLAENRVAFIFYGSGVPPRHCCDGQESDGPIYSGIGGSLM